jgi:hypothetical protein
MIVFLTEEKSMKVTIESLVRSCWSETVNGVDWIVLSFEGKNDLEKNIPIKMGRWNYANPHFVILRDQDGGDCIAIKKRIEEKALVSGKPYTARIVCNELESWLLGDLNAIQQAYPKCKAMQQSGKAKFRDPDRLANASQELEKLVDVTGKVSRATAVARHFNPERCRSHSFQIFWNTVTSLME